MMICDQLQTSTGVQHLLNAIQNSLYNLEMITTINVVLAGSVCTFTKMRAQAEVCYCCCLFLFEQ